VTSRHPQTKLNTKTDSILAISDINRYIWLIYYLLMKDYSVIKTPRTVLKNTALKVRDLRRQKKYSQSELADRSGVSLGSLKRFEATGLISLESFLKLIHLLDRLEEFDAILQPCDDLTAVAKLFTLNQKK
jgi:hypothetical protein